MHGVHACVHVCLCAICENVCMVQCVGVHAYV